MSSILFAHVFLIDQTKLIIVTNATNNEKLRKRSEISFRSRLKYQKNLMIENNDNQISKLKKYFIAIDKHQHTCKT